MKCSPGASVERLNRILEPGGEPLLSFAEGMIEPNEFRRVLGHFPSGVTIVTASRPDGTPCGLTVNAFCSVSLVPPLVLICIDSNSESHDCIRRHGRYAVNILDAEQGELLSRSFADPELEDRFAGVAYRSGTDGTFILDEALAWLECRVHQSIESGDHTIFIGEVIAGDAHEGHPLVYYRGGYGRFDP